MRFGKSARGLLTAALLSFPALTGVLPTPPAAAQNRAEDMAEIYSARVLPGWRAADGRHFAALEFVLADGWKTYWRTPGPGGFPPSFDFRASRNVEAVRIHWPTPEIFDLGGIRAIGYKHRLVLPVEILPTDPDLPVTLSAKVDFGVCKDVCMPSSARLRARLPAGGTADPVIEAAIAAVPGDAAAAGITQVQCRLEPTKGGFNLTARLTMGSTQAPMRNVAAVVVELSQPDVWVDEAAVKQNGRAVVAATTIANYSDKPLIVDRSQIRLTIFADGEAFDIQGCPAAAG